MIPIFITGLITWACTEFLVFYPYTSQEWDEADRCKVASVDRYAFTGVTSAKSGGIVYHTYYSLFKVNLMIDGVWRKGFACGSDYASMTASGTINGTYPYDYSTCKSEIDCGTQLMMPVWYCNDCKVCDQYLQEERRCWWFIKQSEEDFISDVEDFPPNYDVAYPTEYSSFIQVRFREDQNFDQETYEAFYATTVGVLMGVPVLIWLGLGIFYLVKWLKR